MFERYMKMAIAQAKKAIGRVSPNPMVGAVIVKKGEIVGLGYHHRAGSPHAEINALRKAGKKAKNAELYVNLEPCCHYGRTPPCVDAIIESGIKQVIIGMKDPNPLVCGKGAAQLRAVGIATHTGFLEEECGKLNEIYIKYITRKVPFVILKVASSLDGKIATKSGDSRGISNNESLHCVHRLRDQCDAIMVGIGTIQADDPLLTTRLKGKAGKDPIRVIVDSSLKISSGARVFNVRSNAGVIFATTRRAARRKKERLEELGVRVVTVGSAGGKVDLKRLMIALGKFEITSLLIEGGTEITTSALKGGIVDKILFFYAPKILGGRTARGITAGEGVEYVRQALNVHDLKVRKKGEDILIEGYIKR
ncbi:MAG: bifunctional diaminohydroxyphosphoribosylaminopyrimidine deaminase/5-amino-6-(5-phosphoribosylamino)uracil reductase RibD [Deltaproteobacteria bacterium]|nr:bifunctional diaminohydroxyphosphoribosylaminopyrimidine deaminase/5-amino-6-(5-phosphoribosylamino)uracil reductase RibD [Deltaproteobacteria bacterium]